MLKFAETLVIDYLLLAYFKFHNKRFLELLELDISKDSSCNLMMVPFHLYIRIFKKYLLLKETKYSMLLL